jgi:hypothetical protein
MASTRGWDEIRSRPGVRRAVLVLLLVGLGAIVAHVIASSPVQADVEVRLGGEWPAVESVTLVYRAAREEEALRSVRWFPDARTTGLTDSPRLAPGTYRVEVTVDTREGPRSYVRELEHRRGGRCRMDLRY